ncbi:MAG: TerB family tellurite resistance protein [Planctomycetes bacterium]|nr:TerB family tellurite resistance protein [Planctomycetota bacterium]
MNDSAEAHLKNALVMVMVDGEVSSIEKAYIRTLRDRLGIGEEEFRALCAEVRADRRRLEVPREGEAAEQALRQLVEAAAADDAIGQAEKRVLQKAAHHMGRSAADLEAMIIDAAPHTNATVVDDPTAAAIEQAVEAMYEEFGAWSDGQRLDACRDIAARGAAAVIPLLRVLESYRAPENGNGLRMKELIVDQLVALGDPRVVYYLAQQVSLGDTDDEVTCASLRAAAAEAIGRLVGEPFTRDAAGVNACRLWWRGKGMTEYQTLVL